MSKELSRKERGGRGSSALRMEGWDFGAALLDVPLPANVFGKDGATAKAMRGGHMVSLCPGNLSFGGDFTRWSL